MKPLVTLALLLLATLSQANSHPPLRKTPPVSQRPLAAGPAKFVDAGKGADDAPGTKDAPWKTIARALPTLQPGDTLYLRAGVYYESLYLALAGKEGAPITIRSYPGEQAILDAGWREFFESPAQAWIPQDSPGEFRSAKPYPNARDPVGSFGDSMIGLQTYHHPQDLRAKLETFEWPDETKTLDSDLKPVYLGPGMWYDRVTGYIHLRLAHTHLPKPVPNYQGEQDPRKLPLVIAPFKAKNLHLDAAQHLRFQDLVLRGAGYRSIQMEQASHIAFDNVTVWAGTYGLEAIGCTDISLSHCGFYGSVAPWTFRSDASKRDYPGRPYRNLSRLNTHALIEIDNGGESSVYATPQNDRWEIDHCEFADAHDGVYLGGINVRFHHNLIDNLQDDGIYLSPMYFRHKLDKKQVEIHIYQNVIRQVLTAFAFGGAETETRDQIYIYRNIVDLRESVPTARPGGKVLEPRYSNGHVMGDHGSPPWSAMNIYHNLFVQADQARSAGMATLTSTKSGKPRRVFNNVFYHLAKLPAFGAPVDDAWEDGNLYYSPKLTEKEIAQYFVKYRASPLFAASKKDYPAGFSTHSRVGSPGVAILEEGTLPWRLAKGSLSVDAGVELPKSWPDPLRETDAGASDIGPLPLETDMFSVGRKRTDK